jgi:hypothetical protein
MTHLTCLERILLGILLGALLVTIMVVACSHLPLTLGSSRSVVRG